MAGLARSTLLLLFAFAGVPALSLAAFLFFGADLYTIGPHIASVCLYLAVANLGWTLGSPGRAKAIVGASIAAVLLAFGLPATLNALISAQAREDGAGDSAPEAKLETPRAVALLTPYETDRTGAKWPVETECTLLCQRLLYGGNRVAVLVGATPNDRNPASSKGLVRYFVEQRATCPHVQVRLAGAMPGENYVFGSYPTSDAVKRSIAHGRCLLSTPGDVSEAQVVAMWSAPGTEKFIEAQSAGGGIATHRAEIFTKSGSAWQRFARSAERHFASVRSPFWLKGDGYKFRPADKEELSKADDPQMVEHVLRPWLGKPS